jgi:hypothetical protein
MRILLGTLLLFASSGSAAVDLVAYDDALQNGFMNFSYGGGSNFASGAQAHGGALSIEFVPGGFNAVKLANDTLLFDTAQYPRLHFWMRANTAGCQAITLILERYNAGTMTDDTVASGSLGSYVNCATIGAGWNDVTVNLAAAPLSYAGTFDRISFFNGNGAALAALYFDDIALQTAPSGVDTIFRHGFESSTLPPAPNGLVQERGVTVGAMLSDRFTWRDSLDRPRIAVLAHNDGQVGPQAPGGGYVNRGGAMREYTFRMPDNSPRTATVTTFGNAGQGGFGYVVSHSAWLSDGFCAGDDSPLGYTYPGTFTRVFEGRHHAIFRFQQNYQRHCGPTNPPPTTLVPVTIDWMFATGRDNPLWAITFDMQAIPANFLFDDSRAPYGEFNIDGVGAADISGTAWGDKFKFASTSAPVTLSSTWSWALANAIPYVKLWITTTNATMGVVQTQTLTQHDAGAGRNPFYHDLTPHWGLTSANGNAGGAYAMPYQDSWPYQANSYSIGVGASSNNARLTWGTQYGFLGQTSYAANTNTAPGDNGPFLAGYPKQSYSTYVVLGAHSTAPVEAQITQVEATQSLTLTTLVGSVVTTGPSGVNRAGHPSDTMTYAPPGYDPVYGALTFNAAGNALDANVAVGAGSLAKPLFVVKGATAYPSTVRYNGATLVVDVDYHPSLRTGPNELWITLNRTFTGATNRVELLP